jgi:hypothetical protein
MPPSDNQFDNTFIFPRADGDLDQIQFGTPGKDKIEQYGGTGNTTQFAEGSADNDWILQLGGDLRTDQTAIAGSGDDKIYQYGGKGNNTMILKGSTSDDTILMHGDAATDTMNYTVTGGSDKVTINAAQGDDILTIKKNQKNFTLVDSNDNAIFKSGDGGSTITITNIEHIKVIGDDGTIIFQWDAS